MHISSYTHSLSRTLTHIRTHALAGLVGEERLDEVPCLPAQMRGELDLAAVDARVHLQSVCVCE
jgi:hypothetical protein